MRSRYWCAGISRHEAENAKFLRERTSDPLGPESCADTARNSVKRRQGYRRGGGLRCGTAKKKGKKKPEGLVGAKHNRAKSKEPQRVYRAGGDTGAARA